MVRQFKVLSFVEVAGGFAVPDEEQPERRHRGPRALKAGRMQIARRGVSRSLRGSGNPGGAGGWGKGSTAEILLSTGRARGRGSSTIPRKPQAHVNPGAANFAAAARGAP